MATDKQIKANQENAQHATGPRTTTGKARSSQNALKHGLDAKSEVMRCESQDDYNALVAEYYTRYNPPVPEERRLVDDLIRSEWLGRRYMAAATAIWERDFHVTDSRSVGQVFIRQSEVICRAQRLISANQRDFALSLKQLEVLQAKRAAEPALNPAETDATDTETEPLNPKLVSFLTSPEPAPAAASLAPAATSETPVAQPETEENPPIAA
jgi:hypothetical protein